MATEGRDLIRNNIPDFYNWLVGCYGVENFDIWKEKVDNSNQCSGDGGTAWSVGIDLKGVPSSTIKKWYGEVGELRRGIFADIHLPYQFGGKRIEIFHCIRGPPIDSSRSLEISKKIEDGGYNIFIDPRSNVLRIEGKVQGKDKLWIPNFLQGKNSQEIARLIKPEIDGGVGRGYLPIIWTETEFEPKGAVIPFNPVVKFEGEKYQEELRAKGLLG